MGKKVTAAAQQKAAESLAEVMSSIDGVNATVDTRTSGTHCLLYTSPSPRDATLSRMPSSA